MTTSADTKDAGHTIDGPLEVDEYGLGIWAPSRKGGKTKVLDIRAWGYLTGHGAGGLAMGHDAAEAEQRAFGAKVCARFNSHAELLEALKAARDYMDFFGCDKDMAPTMDKIEAAISRAEGR